MAVRAFIAGCSGPELTSEERAFFRDAAPWGFILFRRNIETPAQVKTLTADLRAAVGRTDAPVLVDQEGGRVQRLRPPHWPSYPAGRAYGALLGGDRDEARRIAYLGARLIAHDLTALGIDVDCLPVLDVPAEGSNDVIGDRAYAHDPADVAFLGRAAADGLMAGGVLPVMKHAPGHGRAQVDSHLTLPIVDAPRETLARTDFSPFVANADLPAAMTGHVVYTALDPDHPATTSRIIVQDIIRGALGFDGLLMTDDLSMQALKGGFRDRAEAALAAGCDLVLHCNGQMDEMRGVAEAAPDLAGVSARRAEAALARRGVPQPFDVAESRAHLFAALGLAA